MELGPGPPFSKAGAAAVVLSGEPGLKHCVPLMPGSLAEPCPGETRTRVSHVAMLPRLSLMPNLFGRIAHLLDVSLVISH